MTLTPSSTETTAPVSPAMMPTTSISRRLSQKLAASDDPDAYRADSIEEIEEIRIRHHERSRRFTRIRRAAENDIKNVADASDLDVLHDPANLYLWYRAVESIEVRAEHHSKIKRIDLDRLLKIAESRELTDEEEALRRELEKNEAKRQYFIGKVEDKLDEISAIMHPLGMTGDDRMALGRDLRHVRDMLQLGRNRAAIDELMEIIRDLEHDDLTD